MVLGDLEKIFNDLERTLTREIDSFFNETKKIWGNLLNLDTIIPKVNISEKNNQVFVSMKIPGLSKQHNLKVNLDHDHLIVYGDLLKENEVISDYGGKMAESYSEYFYRTIPLPVRVTNRGARATYNKDTLNISLYKIGELDEKNKNIDVDFR